MAKLNFLQWLGVALLIVGVAWFVYNKSKGTSTTRRTKAEPPGERAVVVNDPLTLTC